MTQSKTPLLPTLWKRGADGRLRYWYIDISNKSWRTLSGVKNGGRPLITAWNHCTSTTEAYAKASAAWKAKSKREYREDINQVDSVARSPMLASPYTTIENWPVYAQPKLDGIRATVSRRGAFSRELQEFLNVSHIKQALSHVFNAYPDLVLDGELYNHQLRDNFNKISSCVRKKTPTQVDRADSAANIKYYVYDADIVGEFDDRYAKFSGLFADNAYRLQDSPIVLVPTVLCETQDELDLRYGECIFNGYEGQMIRLPGFGYEAGKRSKSLMKRKDFVTNEYGFIGFETGSGIWQDKAKSAWIVMPNGNTCKVGIRGTLDYCAGLLVDSKSWDFSKVQVTVRHPEQLTPDGFIRFGVAVDFHPNGRED